MKASAVRVFVHDLAAAQIFYSEQLGLPCNGGDLDWGYLSFDLGGVNLLIERETEEPDLVGRFVGLSFETTDIQQTFSKLLQNGVHFTEPPQPQAWGGWLAHFIDPSGNELTLVQVAEAVAPSHLN